MNPTRDDVDRYLAIENEMLAHVIKTGWLKRAIERHNPTLPPLRPQRRKEIDAQAKLLNSSWRRFFGSAKTVSYSLEQYAQLRSLIVQYAEPWLQSAIIHRPVDRQNEPIPFIVDACFEFLKRHIQPDYAIFEFGSGGSTMWWAKAVKTVVSVEHHPCWYDAIKVQLPSNVDYLHRTLVENGDYSRAAAHTGKQYDLIFIDGRDRVNCALNSIGSLSPRGVFLWDNSERERYRVGQDELCAKGFRRLDFIGAGPVHARPWETAIFYRDGNCLGL
jgi:hypothetical protein